MRGVALSVVGLSLATVAPAQAQYVVRRGDTLSSVAAAHHVSVAHIQRLNPSLRNPNRIRRGQRLRLRAARRERARHHRVRRGETLTSIAARRGMSVSDLVAANRGRLRNPDRLDVGMRLRLPSTALAPAEACGERLIFESRVSPAFARRVREVSGRLRMNPDHLMAVMHYETAGTFRASVRNRHSRAVGLIQFLPSTARRLGTSAGRLARMGPVAQLAWVERYLRPYRGRLTTIEDAYMAVFTPAAIGRPDGHVLYRRPSRTYRRNRGHDLDGDGRITRREVGTNARRRYEQGAARRSAICARR